MVAVATQVPRRKWVHQVARALAITGAGFLAGVIWGALARLWMRWTSTEPEFTWSGTLFIVAAFAVFGTMQVWPAFAPSPKRT
jgi:hypothetical protein